MSLLSPAGGDTATITLSPIAGPYTTQIFIEINSNHDLGINNTYFHKKKLKAYIQTYNIQ